MDMKPIIVMAGTPVDTQMGMDCLSTQGLPGVFCPISEDPNQQTAFQISSTEEKIDTVVSLLCAAQREHGCEKAFIYCNSLSGALDFQFVARETGLKIVTPLDVYRLLAPKYHSLAVIAANAQGTAGIEWGRLQYKRNRCRSKCRYSTCSCWSFLDHDRPYPFRWFG